MTSEIETPDDAFFVRMQNSLDADYDWFGMGEDGTVEALRGAFIAAASLPPKPEEPTGLGAVVEDDKGDLWVVINVAGGDLKPIRQWRTWWGNRPWSDINVVRVLSEGVTS